MNSSENRSDHPDIDIREQDRLRAGRRAAILGGLGKGSAALAALSPLASQAGGQYILPTSTDNHYCSVSGFQSTALSGMPKGGYQTCSAFAPSHFVTSVTVAYVLTGNGGVNAPQTATKLGITSSQLATIRASSNTGELRVLMPTSGTANDYVIYKGNGSSDLTTCTKTTLTDLPDPALKIALFKDVFTLSTNTTARFLDLFVPPGGGALSDDAFFAAAYLSARNDLQGLNVGDIPFDADYVIHNYNGHPTAATFFRALCTKP